jgi:hypothetical protein
MALSDGYFRTVFGEMYVGENYLRSVDDYRPVWEFHLNTRQWNIRPDLNQYANLMRYNHAMEIVDGIIYIYGGINPSNDVFWSDFILMSTENAAAKSRLTNYNGFSPENGRYLVTANAINSDWIFLYGGYGPGGENPDPTVSFFPFNINPLHGQLCL